MVRYVNSAVETKVQVLDSSDDPAESATVSYIVYDEGDSVFATGSMTHIDNGIYTASWTPDATGEWTFECYSSSPKFRKSYVYHVQATTDITHYVDKFHIENYSKTSGIVQSTYYTAFEDTDITEIIYVLLKQTNTETDNKNIIGRVTIDDEQFTFGASALLHNDVEFWYIQYPTDIGTNASLVMNTNGSKFGFENVELAAHTDSYPTRSGGHAVKIEYYFDAAPGTAQTFYMDIYYYKSEET